MEDSISLMRFIQSVVPMAHQDFVVRYMAHVIFSQNPPLVTLWLSSPHAGAGKSILTTEIFSLLVGTAATSVGAGNVIKEWGDIVKGKRVLAIEDVGKSNQQDWNKIYTFIKQQSGNAHRVLDAKYGAISSEKVRVCTTGSSNYKILLDPDDRRFFCLEPAHRDPDQPNQPMVKADVHRIGILMQGNEYSDEVQEFMDHLNYVYHQPLTTEQELHLYERAPNTVYKDRWKVESKGYVRRIIESIPYPDQLHSLVRMDSDTDIHKLYELYQYVLYMYKDDTHKIGLSWKWFAEFIPFVSETHKASSKQSVCDSLGLDHWSPNIGDRYSLPTKHGLSKEFMAFPSAGIVLDIDPKDIKGYMDVLHELKPEGVFTGDDGLEPEL